MILPSSKRPCSTWLCRVPRWPVLLPSAGNPAWAQDLPPAPVLRETHRWCRSEPLAALGLPQGGPGPPTVGFRHIPRDPPGRRVTCLLCARPEPGAFVETSKLCEPSGAASARGPEPKRRRPEINRLLPATLSVVLNSVEFRRGSCAWGGDAGDRARVLGCQREISGKKKVFFN